MQIIKTKCCECVNFLVCGWGEDVITSSANQRDSLQHKHGSSSKATRQLKFRLLNRHVTAT